MTAAAATCTLTLPGAMLKRGFWLYVWRVQTPNGELLYVGRTGDNSSPNATAPYTRMGQHLGQMKNQNALRSHLRRKGIEPHDCLNFELIAHGPIFPEVEKTSGIDRDTMMKAHVPIRNIVGAMEKALAESLAQAGYKVLNKVSWKHPLDESLWQPVHQAFAKHFPLLKHKGQLA